MRLLILKWVHIDLIQDSAHVAAWRQSLVFAKQHQVQCPNVRFVTTVQANCKMTDIYNTTSYLKTSLKGLPQWTKRIWLSKTMSNDCHIIGTPTWNFHSTQHSKTSWFFPTGVAWWTHSIRGCGGQSPIRGFHNIHSCRFFSVQRLLASARSFSTLDCMLHVG